MEDMLQIVLKEYIKNVEDVCNILINSINHSENLHLRNKYDFYRYRSSCKKMEFEAEEISYRLHGIGCMAFNEKMFLDWDFGYRSRWCGIDPWMVSMTLRENKSPYIEYYDSNLIRTQCGQLVEKGIMFKQHGQYYFSAAKDETSKPEFPKKYDTLSIEYFDESWSIPRNKLIDRFMRKSIWVHDQLYENRDNYILKFLSEGKEIYTIPYNDTNYPESAVKIMSDEIIKNL